MSQESLSRLTTSAGETLVEINGLKTYYDDGGLLSSNPVKAVDGVDLEIARGETLGLVGESGCGKTTLGRTLIQLESATEGEVVFDGTNVTELRGEQLKQWRKRTQMVFQDPDSSLNDRMTVGEIIREPLDVHDWKTPPERRRRVRELLETVGLREEHYYRYPHQFSGGQRQRIGIARALALEPEFVVLDEPVSALDASVQAKILNLLEDLQEDFGLTYLFIAHDLSVVRHICDRVAVMYLGNIMEIGPTEELFEDPSNPYTISLLSAIPTPNPTASGDRVTLRGTPPSPRDPPEGCPFSTRCPMKIRPDAYRDVDDELWERVEVFRDIVRDRTSIDRPPSARLRELLGMKTSLSDISEIRTDLFADVDVPSEIERHVETAIADFADGNEEEAQAYLREQFGSECDRTSPDGYRPTDSPRRSSCHRHDEDYLEPEPYYDSLTGED